jgi:hypothetical protein
VSRIGGRNLSITLQVCSDGSESVVWYLSLLRPFVQLDAWYLAIIRFADSADDPRDDLVVRPRLD